MSERFRTSAGADVRSLDKRYRRAYFAYSIALSGFLCIIVGVALYVLHRAWNSHRDDYWSIALPGVATGGGTLALAGVTVWLSGLQWHRDKYMRAVEIASGQANQERENDLAGLREARKVVAVWERAETSFERIVVLNAGVEPILAVEVLGATVTAEADARGGWRWTAERIDAPGLPIVGSRLLALPPGAAISVFGRLFRYTSKNLATGDHWSSDGSGSTVVAEITWTDSGGRRWRRVGVGEPIRASGPP